MHMSMFLCLYAYVCVSISACLYINVYKCKSMFLCLFFVCLYVHVYIFICGSVLMRFYIYIFVRLYEYVYVCMYIIFFGLTTFAFIQNGCANERLKFFFLFSLKSLKASIYKFVRVRPWV